VSAYALIFRRADRHRRAPGGLARQPARVCIGNWSFRLVAPLALLGLLASVLFVGGSLLARQRSAG